jgi:Transglutaminase-like superfamily
MRAGWWAARATRAARRHLRASGLETQARLPSVPPLPSDAARGVHAVLRRADASCLVRSIVLQAWYAARGERRDLVIGVAGAGDGFRAHAWLDGDPGADELTELLRRPAA